MLNLYILNNNFDDSLNIFNHILENDLELKNILLTKNGPIIIDFEKSIFMATKEGPQKRYTYVRNC